MIELEKFDLNYLSVCPNCKSKNITWSFFTKKDGYLSIEPSKSICNNCGYKDEKGQFELTNKLLYREKKINKILNELQ